MRTHSRSEKDIAGTMTRNLLLQSQPPLIVPLIQISLMQTRVGDVNAKFCVMLVYSFLSPSIAIMRVMQWRHPAPKRERYIYYSTTQYLVRHHPTWMQIVPSSSRYRYCRRETVNCAKRDCSRVRYVDAKFHVVEKYVFLLMSLGTTMVLRV